MNISILMGRGIEGTGNTKYAVELQEHIESIGSTCNVYANKDKKWGREKSHNNHIQLISYIDNERFIIDECLKSDLIVVLSVPAKNFEKKSKDSFMNILKEV